MNADEKNRYFQELSRNLRHEGLIVKPETEEGLLPVELDGQRLCLVLDTGAVRYRSAYLHHCTRQLLGRRRGQLCGGGTGTNAVHPSHPL